MVNTPSSVVRGRNLQLDVLRGLAILLVLGAHFKLPYPKGWLGRVAEAWDVYGPLGVELFFVLSGFLIGGLLISEHARHGKIDVTRFLIRRGFKIYPVYYVFLAYLVCMPALKELVGRGDPVGKLSEGIAAYWPNLLFLHTYVGSNPAGHTWSLANEEHFYLLLPFVVLLLMARGRLPQIVTVSLVAVPVFIAIRLASTFLDDPYAELMVASHLRLDALLFGVGIRGFAEYHPEAFAVLRQWRVPLAVAGIVLWLPALSRWDLGQAFRAVRYSITMFGSAAFLVAMYHTHARDFGRWARPVESLAKTIAFVGVYSYAIYVWHVTAIRITERVVATRIGAALESQPALAWLLSVVAVSAAALIVGIAVSHLVEWPAIRLRDRWFPSRSAVLPTASAAEETVPARVAKHGVGAVASTN